MAKLYRWWMSTRHYAALTAILTSTVMFGCTTSLLHKSEAKCTLAQDEQSRFCRKSEGTSNLLVLIHGVTGSATTTWGSWADLAYSDPRLSGFDIYLVNYVSHRVRSSPNIHEITGYELQRFLDQDGLKYEEVHIVAHSMGGLIAKSMLLRLDASMNYEKGLKKVKSVTLLGTPSQGSWLSTFLRSITFNRQVIDLQPAHMNTFLQGMEDQWIDFLIKRDERKRRFPKVFCAYETLPSDVGGFIVPREMASSRCDSPMQPMPFGHSGLVEVKALDQDPYRWAVLRVLDARRIAEQARNIAEKLVEANQALERGDNTLSLQHFLDAEKEAIEIDDFQGQTKAIAGLGTLARRRNDLEASRDLYKDALGRFVTLRDPIGQAKMFRHIADLEVDAGHPKVARNYYTRADGVLTHPQHYGNEGLLEKAWLLLGLGRLECREGNTDEAWRNVKESKALFEAVKNVDGTAWAYMALGNMEVLHGAMDHASHAYETAQHIFEERGSKGGIIRTFIGLGEIARLSGNLEVAKDFLKKAEEGMVASRIMDDREAGRIALHLGRIDLTGDALSSARRHLEHALMLFGKVGDLRGEADVLSDLGAIHHETGLRDSARSSLERALYTYQRLNDRNGEAEVRLRMAKIESDALRADQARAGYDLAHSICVSSSNPRCQGYALLGRGKIEYIKSQYDSARRSIALARNTLESVGDQLGTIEADLEHGRLEEYVGTNADGEPPDFATSIYEKILEKATDYKLTVPQIKAHLRLGLLQNRPKEVREYHIDRSERLLRKGDSLHLKGQIEHARAHIALEGKLDAKTCESATELLTGAIEKHLQAGADQLTLAAIYLDLSETHLQCSEVSSHRAAKHVARAQEYLEQVLSICSADKCLQEAERAYARLMHAELATPVPGDLEKGIEYAYRAGFIAQTGGRKTQFYYFRLAKCLLKGLPHENNVNSLKRIGTSCSGNG